MKMGMKVVMGCIYEIRECRTRGIDALDKAQMEDSSYRLQVRVRMPLYKREVIY